MKSLRRFEILLLITTLFPQFIASGNSVASGPLPSPHNDPGGPQINNQSVSDDNGISEDHLNCVCDGDCEHFEAKDCRWGLTLDFCGCCLICSRGEGEPCGGAVGTCTKDLQCLNHPRKPGEGICARRHSNRPNGGVCSSSVKRYGCLFLDGNCVCENHTICEGIEIFLFPNQESCRSRIAILTAAAAAERSLGLSPATPLSPAPTAPGQGRDKWDGRRDQHLLPLLSPMSDSHNHRIGATGNSEGEVEEDCSHIKCPEAVVKCPEDSYRLPSAIFVRENHCCPWRETRKCECVPGLRCPIPLPCPPGWRLRTLKHSTGSPGACCSTYGCEPDPDSLCQVAPSSSEDYADSNEDYDSSEETQRISIYGDCKCLCRNGVLNCHPVKCDNFCSSPSSAPSLCCSPSASCKE